jgi:hypothetical protein
VKVDETKDLALARGIEATRSAFVSWRSARYSIVARWFLCSGAVAAFMLLATLAVANASHPDPDGLSFPGLDTPPTVGDFAGVVLRNTAVLSFHALACLAGFLAGASMPMLADGYAGWRGKLHRHAGVGGIVVVLAMTAFSLVTQCAALGHAASTLASQLGTSPQTLLAGLLPHAAPELAALFLPLAAWSSAAHRRAWDELLAATLLTFAVAWPVLLVSGAVEIWITPSILKSL